MSSLPNSKTRGSSPNQATPTTLHSHASSRKFYHRANVFVPSRSLSRFVYAPVPLPPSSFIEKCNMHRTCLAFALLTSLFSCIGAIAFALPACYEFLRACTFRGLRCIGGPARSPTWTVQTYARPSLQTSLGTETLETSSRGRSVLNSISLDYHSLARRGFFVVVVVLRRRLRREILCMGA